MSSRFDARMSSWRRMGAIWLILALSAALSLAAAPASALESGPPKVTSASVVLIDAETGYVLYQKNPNQRRAIASTTKVMTGLVTLEAGKLETEAVVSKKALKAGGSSLFLKKGDRLNRQELLWALMLRSANDGAVVLAESISGSVPEFSELMNRRAKALGATRTNFNNPHGMPDPRHYSTAHDLSLIAREAMKNPTFREVVATQRYSIPSPNGASTLQLDNHNRLLKRYPLANGIKTGFTNLAKHCLVSSASRNGKTLILVVLGGNSADIVYVESKALFKWGFKTYRTKSVIAPGTVVGRYKAPDADAAVPLVTGRSFDYVLPANAPARVVAAPSGDLTLPIRKGDELGEAIAVAGDANIGSVPLVASADAKAKSLVVAAAEKPIGFLASVLGWIAGLFR